MEVLVLEGTILYHASKEIVEFPEVRKTKFTKDFSWGFYCTKNLKQAVRWANRGFGEPVVNRSFYRPMPGLKILKFEIMTDEWLDYSKVQSRRNMITILWMGLWRMTLSELCK